MDFAKVCKIISQQSETLMHNIVVFYAVMHNLADLYRAKCGPEFFLVFLLTVHAYVLADKNSVYKRKQEKFKLEQKTLITLTAVHLGLDIVHAGAVMLCCVNT